LPGGARRFGESALEGALREADEEAGVPADLVDVLFESVVDLGFWSYTTVVVQARQVFEPVMGDTESIALAWVSLDDVATYDLHPGFAASWPALLLRIQRQ
jgi:8-oxo-dGTP pyrophosphatase MutT (NUDIX family)